MNATPEVNDELTHLSETDSYRLLADERRRLLLDVLAQTQLPVDIEELARLVVRREQSVGETDGGEETGGEETGGEESDTEMSEASEQSEIDETTLSRVKIDIYHSHLPLLADLNVVEFDTEEKKVRGFSSV